MAEANEAAEEVVVGRIHDALAQHAPASQVRELLSTLERCFVLGDGCVVVSHTPPRLEGAVPGHLWMWARVPELVRVGHL